MTTTDRAVRDHPVELDVPFVSAPLNTSLIVLEEPPAAPPAGPVCGERLPRDVVVRLAALSRQVGHIRQSHAVGSELSLRLANVAAGLDALVQSIYDETVLHYAGRRG